MGAEGGFSGRRMLWYDKTLPPWFWIDCVAHPLSKRSSVQISSPCFFCTELHEHWTFYQQLPTGERTPKCVCHTYCTIFADSWNRYFPTALHHTLFLLPSLPLSPSLHLSYTQPGRMDGRWSLPRNLLPCLQQLRQRRRNGWPTSTSVSWISWPRVSSAQLVLPLTFHACFVQSHKMPWNKYTVTV